eukprot:gene1651-12776_t
MSLTNYWKSTQYQNWLKKKDSNIKIVDELEEHERKLITNYYVRKIKKLCEALKLHHRIVSTASIYFKRFYQKNSLIETEPTLIYPTCILLSSKVEESAITCHTILQALQIKEITISDLAQTEFYLISELDFSLIVFHPFKSLKLFLNNSEISFFSQTSINILNDSYYSDISLQYPPHIIALSIIYITGILEKREEKIRLWFDQLNVSMNSIGEVINEIVDMYEILKDFDSKIYILLQKYEKIKKEKIQ